MMTLFERLAVRLPYEKDQAVLEELLESAKDIVLELRFPFEKDRPDEVPAEYISVQLQIAEDMYNRLGASGQLAHTENSIGRTWGSEWVSRDLLRLITPKVGGLK